jgi:hypothetical protein
MVIVDDRRVVGIVIAHVLDNVELLVVRLIRVWAYRGNDLATAGASAPSVTLTRPCS